MHEKSITTVLKEIVDESTDPGSVAATATNDPVPEIEKVRVLIIPAKDTSDELAGNMLGALLDAARWEVDVSPVAQLTSEVIGRANEFEPAVIVICTLPPGGMTHTRYVCKRIAKQFSKSRIVVSRCSTVLDAPESAGQLSEAGASYVATSLADTVHHLQTWLGALDSQQKVAVKVKEAKSIGITTAQSNIV